MFGLLFGYGVAQIVRRQGDASPRTVRRLLWRRSGVLVLVGLLHGLLLYVGDILAACVSPAVPCSVDGALAGSRVARGCRVLLRTDQPARRGLPLSTSSALPSAMLPPDLATMFTSRPPVQLFVAMIGPIGFACPFLVGLWVGRRQLLADPTQHRTPQTHRRARPRRRRPGCTAGVSHACWGTSGARPSKPQRHRDAARLHRRSRRVGGTQRSSR